MRREHFLFIIVIVLFTFCYSGFVLDPHLDNMKKCKNSSVIIIGPAPKISSYVIKDKIVDYIVIEDIIRRASELYGIDKNLIKAIIEAESNWDPDAVSEAGAKGLMQLMPKTAEYMGVKDPFDPEDNIFGGTKYLRYLMDLFNENLEFVIAAYNAGPAIVIKLNRVPRIPETRKYIERVFKHYDFYRKEQKGIDV